MSLTLDELLAAAKREPKKVRLPELRRDVWVRALSAEDGLSMAAQFKALDGVEEERPGTLARERAAISLSLYLCDEEGNQIAANVDDAKRVLASLPMSAVNRICVAGQKLNAMDEDAGETLEKN